MNDIKKKLGFGRVECPHCGEVRQGTEAISEHIEAKHGNVRRLDGAVETLGGVDFAPDQLADFMETIASATGESEWKTDPETENKVRAFAAALPQYKGKRLPEFIIMWRPDCVPVSVHSARWVELALRKGFKLRPPTDSEYNEYWFHWHCPIPKCVDNANMCNMHNERGTDSNHPLKSPEYMVIQHLQSGGKLHRQYFEMHKTELQDKYRAAFAAFEVQMQEADALSERVRKEGEQRTADALAGAAT